MGFRRSPGYRGNRAGVVVVVWPTVQIDRDAQIDGHLDADPALASAALFIHHPKVENNQYSRLKLLLQLDQTITRQHWTARA